MKLKAIVSLGELPIKMKRSYETKLKVNWMSGMYVPIRCIENPVKYLRWSFCGKLSIYNH